MNCPNTILSLLGGSTRRVGLAALALCFVVAPLRANEPPLWVIEDEDSTLYLFGTIHLLDPDVVWLTERVKGAVEAASQVWFETPPAATTEEAQAQLTPVIVRLALSPGRPLSSLLTDEEEAQLERALARTSAPEQLGMALENLKPWFATVSLGVESLMSAGYDARAGVEAVLAGNARTRGTPVLGFEVVEEQLESFAAEPEEEQLSKLRTLLAIDPEQFDAELARSDAAFRAWMTGDTAPLAEIIEAWRIGDNLTAAVSAMSYGNMIANRNENWAGRIEDLLAGEGVAFIAVGAGHLVGPDSVQVRLAARRIAAERL